MITFPARLTVQLRAELHQIPAAQWTANAALLSARYRGERDGGPLVRTALDARSYAAMLMPATYAQISGALAQTSERMPDWAPQSLLDIGSGPGTATWALLERFPLLQSVTSIERDEHLDALARLLHRAHDVPVDQRSMDITAAREWPVHDVVVIGHVLNELSASDRAAVIARAWAATKQVLLIVEPGTSAFFPIITDARQQLIEAGAAVVAPCTHTEACPMRGDWCHYATKIARPDFQRHARQATLPYEEAKYSFVAVSRLPVVGAGVRVLHDPTTHKGYITLEHCSARGIQTTPVLKRHAAAYRVARDAKWGSWVPDDVVSTER